MWELFAPVARIKQEIKLGNFRGPIYRLNVFNIKLILNKRIDDIPILIDYFIENICSQTILKNLGLLIIIIIKLRLARKCKRIEKFNWENCNIITKMIMKDTNIIKESFVIDDDFSVTETLTVPLKEARESFEKQYLISQLKKFSGNISKTAKFIGMERSALHRKLKLLGVKDLN